MLEDRVKKLLEAHSQPEPAEPTEPTQSRQQTFREQANTFVCQHAREEYAKFTSLLKQRAEELNSSMNDSAKFVVGGSNIQLGHVALYYCFDHLIVNNPENKLSFSIGPKPNPLFPGAKGPNAVWYEFRAIASDDCTSILWVGKEGHFDSLGLADFLLEKLLLYYLEHTPR